MDKELVLKPYSISCIIGLVLLSGVASFIIDFYRKKKKLTSLFAINTQAS